MKTEIISKAFTPAQFKRERIKKGYTVQELAEAMGYTRHGIYRKENIKKGSISLPDTLFLITLPIKNGKEK